MIESEIMAIKKVYSDIAFQKEQVTQCINHCMNSPLVEPTVKVEHLDASALFPKANEVKCFRQRFTEHGVNYSWWGIRVDSFSAVYGLEKLENDKEEGGIRLSNLWLSINLNNPQSIKMINLVRINIHHDLF